jgi:hypothetical protein
MAVHARAEEAPTSGPHVLAEMARCARRVGTMLVRRQLHRRRDRLGSSVRLPDGRRFSIFRDTYAGPPGGPPLRSANGDEVTIVVWFHLRAVPSGSRVRRYVFERESILNTLLFAGFPGYLVKLWMVDPATGDYAGLYLWEGRDDAHRYAGYITAVLRPLSVPGSVGSAVLGGDAFEQALVQRSPPT